MKDLETIAEGFWNLVMEYGAEMTPEEILKTAQSRDPRDMPDKIIWGEVFGKRWITLRLKGSGADSIRVAIISELNGPGGGWHLNLGVENENQDLFDMRGTRVTKSAYSALTTLVTEGTVYQTRGGQLTLT